MHVTHAPRPDIFIRSRDGCVQARARLIIELVSVLIDRGDDRLGELEPLAIIQQENLLEERLADSHIDKVADAE